MRGMNVLAVSLFDAAVQWVGPERECRITELPD